MKIVPDGIYSRSPGHFGIEYDQGTKVNWLGCREFFHAYADPTNLREYFYTHNQHGRNSLVEFIAMLEERLDIEPCSQLIETNSNSVTWVEVSYWWLDNPMRHAFFTIMLRAGLNWVGGDQHTWDRTMMFHPYIHVTGEASRAFLDGYTDYSGAQRGWKNVFGGTPNVSLLNASSPPGLRNRQVREMAYYLWESEGRQSGKDVEYWDRAVQIVRGVKVA